MREIRQSGSEGGGIELNRFSLPLCAPVKVVNTRGASPRREEVWPFVAEGNCVAARRGGEQPEANVSSVTPVNSIRPVTLASLLESGEAQVTPTTPRGG
jgi:hypothetical protein